MTRVPMGPGLSLLLILGAANAQDASSLEKTYTALCATRSAQLGETCVALREAIANKPGATKPDGGIGGQSADAGLESAEWGLLARLAGSYWIAGPLPDGTITIHKYVVVENGAAVEFSGYTPGLPMGLRIVFRKGGAPGLLQADVHELSEEKGVPVLFRVNADSLESDWYRFATTFGMGGVNLKKEITLTPEGVYAYLQGYGKGSARPAPVNGFPDGFVQYAAADVAAVEARGKVAGEAAMAQAYRDLAEEKRRQQQERAARFNVAMEALHGALVVAGDVAAASEARSRADLGAALAQANGAQQTPGQHAPSPTPHQITRSATPAAEQRAGGRSLDGGHEGAPLRFVMDISLQPTPGAQTNPTCYSSVITRPGPTGWRARERPPGVVDQARETVLSLKPHFISACRATGHAITSEGDFHWTWNEFSDGDQQVDNARARLPGDVTVDVN